MIEQRSEFRYGDRDIRTHGVFTEEIIEQATDRAFIERCSAHMSRRTERVFLFFDVFEQRLGQRWKNGINILVGALADLGGNVLCAA